MYDVFLMPDPKKNCKGTYDLFSNSGGIYLHQCIDYTDMFNNTSYQYEICCLCCSGRYVQNSLDPSVLDKIIKKTTVTSPGAVVRVEIFSSFQMSPSIPCRCVRGK